MLKKDNIITIYWVIIILAVLIILFLPPTREKFVYATNNYPYLMGIIELGLLELWEIC